MKSIELKREIMKLPFNSSITPRKQYYHGIEFTQANQFVRFLEDSNIGDDLDYEGGFLPTVLLDERGILSIAYKDQDGDENWIGFHVHGEDVTFSYD